MHMVDLHASTLALVTDGKYAVYPLHLFLNQNILFISRFPFTLLINVKPILKMYFLVLIVVYSLDFLQKMWRKIFSQLFVYFPLEKICLVYVKIM